MFVNLQADSTAADSAVSFAYGVMTAMASQFQIGEELVDRFITDLIFNETYAQKFCEWMSKEMNIVARHYVLGDYVHGYEFEDSPELTSAILKYGTS